MKVSREKENLRRKSRILPLTFKGVNVINCDMGYENNNLLEMAKNLI